MVGYYAGAGETRPDAAWVLARRRLGADSFDSLQVVANSVDKPEGNGVLFQHTHGQIALIYNTMHGRLDGPYGPGVRWRTCDLRMRTSDDVGKRWSDVQIIDAKWGHVPRCKPKSDGSVLALLRPCGGQGYVLRSESKDGGRTWSDAECTELTSPFAALDAVKLSDGRLALAWNRNPDARNPLTLALSEDEGNTWPYQRDLVTGEGSFHYPALIQTNDGLLHASFTNNRQWIDHIALQAEWIMGQGEDLPPWDGTGKRL